MGIKWFPIFQGITFLLLSFSLYCLFIINLPLFEETHGLLAINEWSDLAQSGSVKGLITASAILVTAIGTLMLDSIPDLPPGIIGNLWALTYFFLWVDTATALTRESHSISFLLVLVMGVFWIRGYFHILEIMGFGEHAAENPLQPTSGWVNQGIWGWMGFYFGLSFLLLFQTLRFMSQRIPLAFGAYFLCFLNYLLILHIRNLSGLNSDKLSKNARWFFFIWFILLISGLLLSVWRR